MTDPDVSSATDGPWRVSDRLSIVVLGLATGEARSAAARAVTAAEAAGIAVATYGAAAPDESLAAWLSREGPVADLLIADAASAIDALALVEMRRVAGTDPMLVGVMPRLVGRADEQPAWLACPGVTYTVLPDLRCLYVKGSILATFADGSEASAPSTPGGLATRLLRLNRFGFRVAIANHAFVLSAGRVPEPAMARVDLPADVRSALSRHRSSAPLRAERIMQGLDPGPDGRRAIAFDLAHATARHSGTSELARALVGRAAALWPDVAVHVIATPEAFGFHFGGRHPAVRRSDPADSRCFAAVIRIGQPFLWGEMESAVRRAPVLVLFLLDTIGLDCLAHAPDELDALWRFALAEADGLLFNSSFTERQFARRFTIRPGLPRRASLHSLDLADYRLAADRRPVAASSAGQERAEGEAEAGAPSRGILVIGNDFSHKYTREAAALLAEASIGEPVVVLGLPPGDVDGVTAMPAGTLDPERLAALFRSARLVVYPSVYEGFGFPILQALAYRKPILVRPLAPYAEIAAALPEAVNIHRFEDSADLLGLLRREIPWIEPGRSTRPRNWDDATSDLRAVVEEALVKVSYDRVLRRIDMLRGRMTFMRTRALSSSDASEEASADLDRLAGAAGRLAQTVVMGIGRRVPGAHAVLGLAGRALRARRGS